MSLDQLNFTTTKKFVSWTVQATLILDTYLQRTTGVIGIIVNIFFVLLLSHGSLKHKIYGFLSVRQLTSLMACLVLAATNDNCLECYRELEWQVYYFVYILITFRIFSIASFISDIFLIFNRYFEIEKKTTFFKRLSKKLNLSISLSFPFLLALPCFFIFSVGKNTLNQKYLFKFNDFGESVFLRVYLFGLFLIDIILIFLFVFINILSVLKFKDLMKRHASLTGNTVTTRKAENRFTKMVLFLSIIISQTRVIDLIISIFLRINAIAPNLFNESSRQNIIFLKGLSNLSINMAFAFDGLIYLRMDRKIWNLVFNFRKSKKVILLKSDAY